MKLSKTIALLLSCTLLLLTAGCGASPKPAPSAAPGGDFYPCRYRNAGADGHARTHADRDARADVHEPADR